MSNPIRRPPTPGPGRDPNYRNLHGSFTSDSTSTGEENSEIEADTAMALKRRADEEMQEGEPPVKRMGRSGEIPQGGLVGPMNELNIKDFEALMTGATHSSPVLARKKKHADENIEVGCSPLKRRLVNLGQYQADAGPSNTLAPQQGSGSGSATGDPKVLQEIPDIGNVPRPTSRQRSLSEGDKSTSLSSSDDSDLYWSEYTQSQRDSM